jgi:hypothetical protein
LFLCATAAAQDARVLDATKALHDLFAGDWDYRMEQYPT